MWNHATLAGFIKNVLIPLSGIALAFFLAHQPAERPSLAVLAALMMGFPIASAADRLRSKGSKEEDE